MTDLRFETDLRAVLSARDPQHVPGSLSEAMAALGSDAAPGRRFAPWLHLPQLGFDRVASLATALVGAVMVIVIGALLVVSFAARAPEQSSGAGDGERAFTWQTQAVTLEADDLVIEAGGRSFRPPVDAEVVSDPGSDTSRTLEMTWFSAATEMRLNVYFEADDANWWVSEIRTYDGGSPGAWIYYQAPTLRAERGQSFAGDIELAGSGPRGAGQLRIDNLRLSAFAALPTELAECQPGGPVASPNSEPRPMPVDPDLSRLGIEVGMEARLAATRLASQNICHEFRFEYPASNFGQRWCSAPPGLIRQVAILSDGLVLLFVEAAPTETAPPGAPLLVGC